MQEDSQTPWNTSPVLGFQNHSQFAIHEKFQFFRLPFRTLPGRKIKQDFQNPKRILIYILVVLSLFSIALRQDSNNPILRSPQNFHSQNFVRL